MTDLFDRFDLKGLPLSNRAVMSAMTRTRATEDDVPTDLMRDYYVQRASAGHRGQRLHRLYVAR
jgi:N-ethylmaleimide reductase